MHISHRQKLTNAVTLALQFHRSAGGEMEKIPIDRQLQERKVIPGAMIAQAAKEHDITANALAHELRQKKHIK